MENFHWKGDELDPPGEGEFHGFFSAIVVAFPALISLKLFIRGKCNNNCQVISTDELKPLSKLKEAYISHPHMLKHGSRYPEQLRTQS